MLSQANFKTQLKRIENNYRKGFSPGQKKDLFDWFTAKRWTDEDLRSSVDHIIENLSFFPNLKDFKKARPERSRVWEPEKPAGDQPQFAHTKEEDEEIEALIQGIGNKRLEDVCRRILRIGGTNGVIYPRCNLCNDSGLVEVYHPKTCRRARAKQLKAPEIRTCTIACNCRKAPEHGRKFDADLMPRVTEMDSTGQLFEVSKFYERSPVNDFADWSR